MFPKNKNNILFIIDLESVMTTTKDFRILRPLMHASHLGICLQ
jgi:hypothetical protein